MVEASEGSGYCAAVPAAKVFIAFEQARGLLAEVNRKRVLIAGIVGVVLLAALSPLLWEHRELVSREYVQALADLVASKGPLLFFGLLALLPLAGVPVSPFLLVAPAFGTAVALTGCISAMATNMALGWLIAGRLFRPFFERLVARFGYSVPELSPGRMTSVAVMLRIMPGMPFPLQNYLLGLARMPFGRYMAVSLPLNAAVVTGIVLAGDAILKGSVVMAFGAAALLIALAIGLRALRARYKRQELEKDLHGSV